MNGLSRRDFLRLTAISTTVVLTGGNPIMGSVKGEKVFDPDKLPNVVVMITDDQRFDTIRALGNENIVTPNMDSIVQNGVSFTHAYIMGSMNGAVCMPSRAMLMSGRTLFRVPDDLSNTITFPEVLKNAGYTTFGVGKWHNQPSSFARCFTGGDKIFFGGMSDHLKVPVYDFDPSGKYTINSSYIGEKFSSELFSDAAVKFLNEYDGKKPFLLYVAYTAPHDPRTPPQKYKDMYDPKKIPVPKNFMPEHPFDNGEMHIRDEELAPFPRIPEIIQKHIAEYYGMITHLDAEIGKILTTLNEKGYADDTIIVFAGDNGLALGQHGLMGKQSLYEHSIRVPLIISGPGVPKGKRSDAFCYLLDIFPTICDLTWLPVPKTVEGLSLVPVITGKKQEARYTLYFAYKDFQRAVRNERYKLIEYNVNGKRTTQFFDLFADPLELSNLSEDAAYSRYLKRLKKELIRWQDEVDDPYKLSYR